MVNCACAFNQPELGKYFEWIFELIISVSIVEFALGNQEINMRFFIEILHPVFEHPGFQVQSTEFLSVFLKAHPCLIAHKFALTQGFWYLAEKKQNFVGFSGANSQKNQPISRDFRGEKVKIRGRFCWIFVGKKSKFAEQSADFVGF